MIRRWGMWSVHRPGTSSRPVLGVLGTLLCVACQPPVPSEGEVQASVQALVGALPDAEDRGLVEVRTGPRRCAGVLLTNRYVMTAAACLCDVNLADPQGVEVRRRGLDGRSVHSVTARYVATDSATGTALIRLRSLLPLSRPQQLLDGPASALVGDTLTCHGSTWLAPDDDDGGAPAASFQAAVLREAESLGSVEGCGTTVVSGLELGSPQPQVELSGVDVGTPCFQTAADSPPVLVGYLGGYAPATGRMWLVPLDRLYPFIRAQSNIWTRARCERSVAGSRFMLDPSLTWGPPGLVSLAAKRAYPEAGQSPIALWQTTHPSLDSWTELPGPPLGHDIEGAALGASFWLDQLSGDVHLELLYIDASHQPRLMWRSPRDGRWYDRDGLNGMLIELDGGPGSLLSPVQLRAPPAIMFSAPTYVVSAGHPALTQYPVDQPGVEERYIYNPVPTTRLADPRRRSTVAHNGWSHRVWMGYRTLEGAFETHIGTWGCNESHGYVDYWCEQGGMSWDLLSGERDVALGELLTDAEFNGMGNDFAISTDEDGSLRAWSLDVGSGRAAPLGELGDVAVGMPATMHFEPVAGQAELLVAYTAADWTLRLRPAGNCLGNTPSGW